VVSAVPVIIIIIIIIIIHGLQGGLSDFQSHRIFSVL